MGFQVYSQPIFAAMERVLTERYPQNKLITKFYGFKLPSSRGVTVTLSPMRLCLRTTYVVIITGVSILFPYFNEVLGVLGAVGFWPLAVYFPVEMCILQKKIPVWTRQWILLRAFSFVCLLVSVLALVGSIYGLVAAKLRWLNNLLWNILGLKKTYKVCFGFNVFICVYAFTYGCVLTKIIWFMLKCDMII